MRPRALPVALVTSAAAALAAPAPAPAQVADPLPPPAAPSSPATVQATQPAAPRSRALGSPWRGHLARGVQLPVAGPGYLSYDAVLDRLPDRGWRRWGTDELVALLERICAEYAAAHPEAPPVLIGDLSRRRGGIFDERYGGLGHASHQNGLDADVYYPRRDRRPTAARRPRDVDRGLAQDLVDRFAAAGAQKLFVGLRVRLHGPRRVALAIPYHDDHVHVRIPNPGR
ncbi:MAG TPA: penicillin-insensitive murein endopeptidase [Solirubrobacteraceae bacterium]|nr:penicillin-insensitive murein endopeptidase [Solirubrobacteraceae bacterium]